METTPAAGDTVNNGSGKTAQAVGQTFYAEPKAKEPLTKGSDGDVAIKSEAEQLIQEAQEVARKAIQDKDKAEQKIIQLKREGKDESSEDFTAYKDETAKRFGEIENARKEDQEAMKIVVESLLNKTRESNELKAIIASKDGSTPNISSHNPPTPIKEGEYSYADQRIAKHFNVELK